MPEDQDTSDIHLTGPNNMANLSTRTDGKSEHAPQLGRQSVPLPTRSLNKDKDKRVQQYATFPHFSTGFAESFATQEPAKSIVRKHLEEKMPNFFNDPLSSKCIENLEAIIPLDESQLENTSHQVANNICELAAQSGIYLLGSCHGVIPEAIREEIGHAVSSQLLEVFKSAVLDSSTPSAVHDNIAAGMKAIARRKILELEKRYKVPISGENNGTSSNPPPSGLERVVQRLETAATRFEESAQDTIKSFNAVIEAQASFIEYQRTADEHVNKMKVVEAKLEGLLPTLLLLEDHCSRNAQSASEISSIKQQVKELLEDQQHQTKTFQESHDQVKDSYDRFMLEARRRLPQPSQS